MPPSSVPTGTYRLQLRPEFGFDDAREVLGYLRDLGVSHAYLSPVLQAAPGSTHGYDVVDHSRLSEDLGGAEAFRRLSDHAAELGLGLVVDVVPNHMAVPTPASLNLALWSVLRDGPGSPYASWFDVDWAAQERAVLMPVLGRRVGLCVRDGEIVLDRDGDEPVLRYHDHVFPVRPGTEDLPLPELLDRQFYRLAYWRVGDEELNYRRFFDIDTLAGVRVEDEAVLAETHGVLLALVAEGRLHGLRIDHPDGLADPSGYLRRLRDATDGAWVVVEKILEGEETLPADWPCAGTTGYDALLRAGGLFADPQGQPGLTRLYAEITGEPTELAVVVEAAKRWVIEHGLHAEVHRLVEVAAAICAEGPGPPAAEAGAGPVEGPLELRDHTRRGLREALVELLVAFPVYRAYVVPGEAPGDEAVRVLERSVAVARTRLPEERHDTLEAVAELALGRHGRGRHLDEFVVRFQQTCGPVMAKGVEDTAFYRWLRLTALNEVGGDPERVGVAPGEFHGWCARTQRDLPSTMTTLTTHDTKRSEDVRARLLALTELPDEWGGRVTAWRAATAAYRPSALDPNTEYLVWQTVVGGWPLDAHRLGAYLEKATREAKRHTTWTEPDEAYDAAVQDFARRLLADGEVMGDVAAFVDRLHGAFRTNVLGQRLVAMTMPGVPDVYQGCDLVDLSLVDPDNRRPVDYGERRERLARLGSAPATGPTDLSDEKLLVVSRTLRLRRERPELFGAEASYEALPTGSPHAVGFVRGGQAVTVVTRLGERLRREGGWGDATVTLPAGRWTDRLTGATYDSGPVPVAGMLEAVPVALLVAED